MARTSSFCHPFLLATLTSLIGVAVTAQDSKPPQTIPESSNYTETSRVADVQRFVDTCVGLSHGNRLAVSVAGKSHEGRAMILVKVSLPAAKDEQRLRALVIGNIHAGEVEGKEAVQELLREFASGKHEALLRQCDVWFVPIYNLDGNEAVKVGNRRGQNGPDAVGQRANAQRLDLNRDFVKADAPETRVMLSLFREIDPHLFVDLHTTNGSHHGYHLTYAPSLSSNLDPAVDQLGRQLLEQSRKKMKSQGFDVFDYGNFETRDWDGSGAPSSNQGVRGWFTYDHRPRYGINYYGLRNRIGILSEAYSYADFKTRIAATRAFVLTLLKNMAANKEVTLATMATADRRARSGEGSLYLGTETKFGDPEQLDILVGTVLREGGKDGKPLRFTRVDKSTKESLPVARRFRSRKQSRLPNAWAITAPTPEVVQRLQWHGIRFRAVETAQTSVVRQFEVTKKRKPKRPYQGHQELVLAGKWLAAKQQELPLGTIIIPANQRLAMLAATMLEPLSEDSLSSWNFFEAATDTHYPVLRVLDKQPTLPQLDAR
ncbi:MAG: hypothetical protein ACI85K_003010 [Hyphomicrobiaceae bacterium]|jgi:hypothetical protein